MEGAQVAAITGEPLDGRISGRPGLRRGDIARVGPQRTRSGERRAPVVPGGVAPHIIIAKHRAGRARLVHPMGAVGGDEAVAHHLLLGLPQQRHARSRVVVEGGVQHFAAALQLDAVAAAAHHHRALHERARPRLHTQPVLPTPAQPVAHQRRPAPAHAHAVLHAGAHRGVPHHRAHPQRQAPPRLGDDRSLNHRAPASPHSDAVPGATLALGRELHRRGPGAPHHQRAVHDELHPPRILPGLQRVLPRREDSHSGFDDQLHAPTHGDIAPEHVGASALLPDSRGRQRPLYVRGGCERWKETQAHQEQPAQNPPTHPLTVALQHSWKILRNPCFRDQPDLSSVTAAGFGNPRCVRAETRRANGPRQIRQSGGANVTFSSIRAAADPRRTAP